MITDKNEMYRRIYDMRKHNNTVAKAYADLAIEKLEDKEHLLMAIVLEQDQIIQSFESLQAKLMTNYYRGVKQCKSYAEIQQPKSTTTAQHQ